MRGDSEGTKPSKLSIKGRSSERGPQKEKLHPHVSNASVTSISPFGEDPESCTFRCGGGKLCSLPYYGVHLQMIKIGINNLGYSKELLRLSSYEIRNIFTFTARMFPYFPHPCLRMKECQVSIIQVEASILNV